MAEKPCWLVVLLVLVLIFRVLGGPLLVRRLLLVQHRAGLFVQLDFVEGCTEATALTLTVEELW